MLNNFAKRENFVAVNYRFCIRITIVQRALISCTDLFRFNENVGALSRTRIRKTSRLDVWLGLLELEISIDLLIQPSAEY